jgi:hypothetical protein
MADMDWIIVRDFRNREIGALGIIGNKVAVICAFYDDRDADKDGAVGWGEAFAATFSPIGVKNMAVTEVAMAARTDADVLMRDPSFANEAVQMWLKFASGLIVDGVYAVYFSRAVSGIATPIAGRLVDGTVKQFVVRKGMEAAVKQAYKKTMGR